MAGDKDVNTAVPFRPDFCIYVQLVTSNQDDVLPSFYSSLYFLSDKIGQIRNTQIIYIKKKRWRFRGILKCRRILLLKGMSHKIERDFKRYS